MSLCLNCLKPGCDSKACWPNRNLFVYGTLKKGRGNDHLLKQATFIGPAVSVGHNFMLEGLMVNEFDPPEPTAQVRGELYHVPTVLEWMRLDRLESHPWVYRRKIRTFIT